MPDFFDLVNKPLEAYCEAHTSAEDEVLYRLFRETHLTMIHPRMLSCHQQGVFLQFISCMTRPKYVLELGTYTGYATICLSAGLTDEGCVFTIEKDVEKEDIIRKYIRLAGIENKTQLLLGHALEIIPTLPYTWDLIFMDADKINYLSYYKLLIDQLSDRGVLLADNVLWSGKVLAQVKDKDRETEAILAFNDYVQADLRVQNMILPIRDGLMMVRKR
jgi:predicted O-methyltransferase YrrM